MDRSRNISETKRKRKARLKQLSRKGWALKDKRSVGIFLQTPKRCSCWMCGNARKYFKRRTIKEERDLEILKEELKDLSLIPSYR